MKYLAALPIAAVVMIGLASSAAQAFQLPSDYHTGYQADAIRNSAAAAGFETERHACRGLGSGTANAACGTRTGGPVGGLH